MIRTIKDLIDQGRAIRGMPVRVVQHDPSDCFTYRVSHTNDAGQVIVEGRDGVCFDPSVLTVDEAALWQQEHPAPKENSSFHLATPKKGES